MDLGLESVAHKVGSRDTAAWLLAICRGEDSSAVKPNLRPKSLNSFKSFVVHDQQELQGWLELLCGEWTFVRTESSTGCLVASVSCSQRVKYVHLACSSSVRHFGWRLIPTYP